MSPHPAQIERLKSIQDHSELIEYLRDELEWPIEEDSFGEDLYFDYEPVDLGIRTEEAAKIDRIRQLRPLTSTQPWGIFFIDFEPKRLPRVALRRILRALVKKKRGSDSERATWRMHDLLFISAIGEKGSRKKITFAHFSEAEEKGNLPILRVFEWDNNDTNLKLDFIRDELHSKLRWPDEEGESEQWRERWSSIFRLEPKEVVRTAEKLSIILAELAKDIHDQVLAALKVESEEGPLRKIMESFKEALIHDLTDETFADMYAQTITYGLLSARVSRKADFQAENMKDMVPVTSPFLKEMFEDLYQAGGRDGKIDYDEVGITDVVDILKSPKVNMEAILLDFGDRNPNEDPVIHFYESFLREYNPTDRKKRGVFYTPKPVVSCIVRSVDELLRTEFGLEDGLADTTTWGEMAERFEGLEIPEGAKPEDPFVQILDPATGTGTFLVETIEVIHKTMTQKWKRAGKSQSEITALWNEYVPDHLLPRLFGYELLMAPYAIAHMKLGLKLHESGYTFTTHAKVNVYLTNSLEPPGEVSQQTLVSVFPALAHEAQAVNAIKQNKIYSVVLGNPPYSGHSVNTGDWITNLIRDYYTVDGKPLGERNPKWLLDDYVKFIRFGQYTLSNAGIGLLGFITNHSFLDNPTFRGMRRSFLDSFADLRFIDLHGNSKKREQTSDGTADENVFDIQQGVAITIGIVMSTEEGGLVKHADLLGTRSEKYSVLLSDPRMDWKEVLPTSPFYLFFPQDETLRNEYERGFRIIEAMPVNVLGFQSHRDHFAVAFTDREIEARIKALRTNELTDKEIKDDFNISDNRDWKVRDARLEVSADNRWKKKLIKCAYRPFDIRSCYFSTVAMDYPRRELIDHVAWRENLCLNTTRQTKLSEWRNAIVTDKPSPAVFVELKDGSNIFPLWLYPAKRDVSFSIDRKPNYSEVFLKSLSAALKVDQQKPFGLPLSLDAEDIFYYIYAILNCATYRSRYLDFLKIDFPRVPLTDKMELFKSLSSIGQYLCSIHLMRFEGTKNKSCRLIGHEQFQVENVCFSDETVWIDKSKTKGFKRVPEEVWEFQVGGYQVCEKWLKDRAAKGGKNPRPGRVLTKEDIEHYQKIVVAIKETIRIMGEIDEVIEEHGGWPDAFITEPIDLGEKEDTLFPL